MKKLMKCLLPLLCINMFMSLSAQPNMTNSQDDESLKKKIEVIRSEDVEPTEIFDDEMGVDAEGYTKDQPEKGLGGIPLAPSSY